MNIKTKRILVILTACLLLLFAGNEFLRRVIGGFAGSYPYVEYWDINAPEKEVINAIKNLKTENSNLNPPNQIEYPVTRDTGYIWDSYEMLEYKKKLELDSLTPLPEPNYDNTFHDYWLYFDFYYSDTKDVVHTWTRPRTDNVTTLAFFSLSEDKRENERLINKDFWYLANKKQINKFKHEIVDRIQTEIDKEKAIR